MSLRIAYATLFDARDVRRGSGAWTFLTRELERQGHQVLYLQPKDLEQPLMTQWLSGLARRRGKFYRSFQDPFIGRRIGRAVSEQLTTVDCDLVMTTDYAIAAYTKTRKPVVMHTDFVFPRQRDKRINPKLQNLFLPTQWFYSMITRRGLHRASLCLFTAQWAAAEAKSYLGSQSGKVGVAPLGANVRDPSPAVADQRSFQRILEKGCLEFLLIGRDWINKGGPIAVATVEELNRSGRSAKLHVVGPSKDEVPTSANVESHGFLDKDVAEDRNHFETLLRQTDAVLLPTRAEGFGLVPAEAAAYGLPVITHDTFGVNETVIDGETGFLLPLGSSAESFREKIETWFATPQLYDSMAAAARKRYEDHWTWEGAVERLVTTLRERLPLDPGRSQRKSPS